MAKTSDEGARGFAVFISQVDEGSLHAELSEATQDLATKLCEYANRFGRDGKGVLTLTLNFSVDAKGTAGVVADVKTKLPKIPKVSSTFWLTAGGNLSVENPRQQRLALREVAPPAPARELGADAPTVRHV